MKLRMGNSVTIATGALGIVNLKLLSEDCLSLEECHHVSSILNNIISFSYLDKCCCIYMGSKLVIKTPLVNGLYLIEVCSYNLQMDDSVKKNKQDVNKAYDNMHLIICIYMLVNTFYASFQSI